MIEEDTKPGENFPNVNWEGIKQNGVVEIIDADDENHPSMRFKIEVIKKMSFNWGYFKK